MATRPDVFFWRQLVLSADTFGVEWGFTGRGEHSRGHPYGGFNLGDHVGDDAERVATHRAQLAEAVGVERDHLIFMHQCHGAEVTVVDQPWRGSVPPADGVVTTRTDLALAVLVADCTPVLLLDRTVGIVGAVHAGRPGMTGRIVGRAVAVMREHGGDHLEAAVGPSVCGRCYEVPEAMRAESARVSPVSATVSWQGTPAIDVAAGVVDQLQAEGVAVHWVPGCCRESEELYSYRRDGQTGRYAGVVRLVAPRDGST